MKIVVDADTREILGAAILGVGGDEAIHSILGVMYAKAPYTVIQRAVHIHPTVSELIPTMLGELQPLANRAHASDVSASGTGYRAFARRFLSTRTRKRGRGRRFLCTRAGVSRANATDGATGGTRGEWLRNRSRKRILQWCKRAKNVEK